MQPRKHAVTQPNVVFPHLGYALLRTFECGHGRFLHKCSWTRSRLALQLGHCADHGRRSQRVAHAPSRHSVGFRKRSHDYKAISILLQRSDRKFAPSVIEINIALVRDHPNAALSREPHDFSHVFRRHNCPRRIRRRVENNQLGARSDQPCDHFGSEAEAIVFITFEQHTVSAGVAHDIFERNPVRHRQYYVVPVVDQR